MMTSPISSHLALGRPELFHHLWTRRYVSPLYLCMTWLRVNTEYCIYQIQHKPSVVYLEYSIQWVLHTLCTALFQHWLSPAPTQALISPLTMLHQILSIPTITTQLMNWVAAHVMSPSWTTTTRLSALKYCTNHAWSWPPSASPTSLDHDLRVHLKVLKMMAARCVSKLAWSHPPSISWNSHDCGLQPYHHVF